MKIPDLSNVKWRALASFGGIIGGTALGCCMDGISGTAAFGIASLFMNVAAQDAAPKWEEARRDPRHGHANHDLTKLIGSAIARTLYSCAESLQDEGAKDWFSAIGKIATEKYLNICEHQSLEVIRSDRIPDLFAMAAKTEKRETIAILDEVTEIRGEKCSVAFALLDFLREEANQSLNIKFMKAGESALINELFLNVREMFKRSFEGSDRAFGALALDVWGECLTKLQELQNEHKKVSDTLGDHTRELTILFKNLLERVDLIDKKTEPFKKQLDELIALVRNQSDNRLSLDKSDLFAIIESEVRRRLAEQESQWLEDPSINAKTLANAALEAIRSQDFHQMENQLGGSDAVLHFLSRKRDLYEKATAEFEQVSLETGMKIVKWAFAIGNYDVAFKELQLILDRNPMEHRALREKARFFMIKHDYKNALELFKLAIKTAKTIEELAASHYGAGLANLFNRQWKRSISHLSQARNLTINTEAAWISLQATAYLAQAYHSWKKRDDAVKMLNSAIEIGESLANIEDTAECYCHLGMVHTELKNFSIAERMHRKSLEWWMQKGEVLHIGQELINVGEACLNQGKHDEAVAEFEKALPYIEKIQDSLRICWVRRRLATSAAKKGNWKLALAHAKIEVEHAKILKDPKKIESLVKWCDEIEKYLAFQQ